MSEFSLYIIRCADDSCYTGIAVDVQRRFAEHVNGQRGAKYLRGRQPLTLIFQRPIGSRSLASKLEYQVKAMPAAVKSNALELNKQIDKALAELSAK